MARHICGPSASMAGLPPEVARRFCGCIVGRLRLCDVFMDAVPREIDSGRRLEARYWCHFVHRGRIRRRCAPRRSEVHADAEGRRNPNRRRSRTRRLRIASQTDSTRRHSISRTPLEGERLIDQDEMAVHVADQRKRSAESLQKSDGMGMSPDTSTIDSK